MNPRPQRPLLLKAIGSFVFCVGLSVLSAGCSTAYEDHKINLAKAEKLEPALERLPLTVGIYYSPEFRSFAASDNYKSGSTVRRFHFRLGDACEDYLNQAFAALFENTFTISMPPSELIEAVPIDGAIAPRIQRASATGVRIEFFLYGDEGRLLGSWEISGTSDRKGRNAEQVAQSLRAELRDVSAKFLVSFHQEETVEKWLKEKGLSPSNEEERVAAR